MAALEADDLARAAAFFRHAAALYSLVPRHPHAAEALLELGSIFLEREQFDRVAKVVAAIRALPAPRSGDRSRSCLYASLLERASRGDESSFASFRLLLGRLRCLRDRGQDTTFLPASKSRPRGPKRAAKSPERPERSESPGSVRLAQVRSILRAAETCSPPSSPEPDSKSSALSREVQP